MPDRSDPPEYDWLYGREPSASTPSDDPEPTRVMPRASTRAQDAPAPDRTTPTPAPRTTRTPDTRRGFPFGKLVLLLLVAWIAYLVAVPIFAWKRIDQVDAMPSRCPARVAAGDDVPARRLRQPQGPDQGGEQRLGTGGVGDVGQRTDTIMLLHTGAGPSLLLSIPRDSIVPIPGHGTNKINAAFAYGGAPLLVRTIEQNTGLRIDHYVEIGFGGFVNSVDAVGGVEICPTQRMVDRRANLNIKKGCQDVDGITALGYARSRHTSASATSTGPGTSARWSARSGRR